MKKKVFKEYLIINYMEDLEKITSEIISEAFKLWCYTIDQENLTYRADEYVKITYNQHGKYKTKERSY